MQQVERHIILDNRFEDICRQSGLLYNFVTYHYRQAIFGKQEYFSEFDMSTLCAQFNQEDYRNLPAQTAQQVIKLVFKNFKSWIAAKKEYAKDPTKFLGRPKMPSFKTGKKQNIVIFTNQQCKIKDGFVHFPKSANLQPIKTKVDNFQQVRQETYLGKRKRRGLFQSSVGKLLNADVNGAIGICRKKVVCNSFLEKIVDSGLVFRPYSINVF